MRRWNGWGDARVTYPLAPEAVAFLHRELGPAPPGPETPLEQVAARVPEATLPAHPLLRTEPEIRVRHALGQSFPDWVEARYGTLHLVPQAVAYPENEEQVRELLQYARAVGARLLPYGGGTSVVGHLRFDPDRQPVIVVAMARMNRLLHLDARSGMATFQAGVRGPDLEAALQAHGFTLGHFPQSFEYATLGGWVATRSVGQESLRYGRIEHLFLGGRVETPLGTWDLPPHPGSATGPDLRQVVLGSEGRAGVITRVVVRVSRRPPGQAFWAAFFPAWEPAWQAARALAQERLPLHLVRLSNPTETRVFLALAGDARGVRWLRRWLRWRGFGEEACLMVLSASGAPRELGRLARRVRGLVRAFRGMWGPHAVARHWARNRFRSPYLRNTLWDLGYGVDTVETAVPWARVPTMVQVMEQALRQALEEQGERVLAFTHLSHLYPQGSSVYTTFLFRLTEDAQATLERWRRLKRAVTEAILAHGGTLSHQHGLGQDHEPYLLREKGPVGLHVLQSLWRTLDPEGLFQVRTLPEPSPTAGGEP